MNQKHCVSLSWPYKEFRRGFIANQTMQCHRMPNNGNGMQQKKHTTETEYAERRMSEYINGKGKESDSELFIE